jgi:Translation initiation factor IF-2, N-terminal region
MGNDFMKRGYLLPEGCKDLLDVLRLTAKRTPKHAESASSVLPSSTLVELEVPEELSVAQLAGLLGENPADILFELIKLGIYRTINQPLDFETISLVLRKHGFLAKRLD